MNALQQAEVNREWLSYEEARQLVGLSRSTLYKLVKAGEVRGARIGRTLKINRAALEGYMDRRLIGVDEAYTRKATRSSSDKDTTKGADGNRTIKALGK